MKLRIKGNSIRLRLLRSEVEKFAAEGSVAEEINFGDRSLRYMLTSSSDADSTHAVMQGDGIAVIVPKSEADAWASSDEVGIEAEQSVGESDVLSILIEKDFACVGRPDDPDRADAFEAR